MSATVRIIVAALILTALLAPAGAGAADSPPAPPTTTGPIITDTAVPIDTGHFSLQPYWSLGLVAGKFSPNWRRVSAGGNFASLEDAGKARLRPGPPHRGLPGGRLRPELGRPGGIARAARQSQRQFCRPERPLFHRQIPASGGDRESTHSYCPVHGECSAAGHPSPLIPSDSAPMPWAAGDLGLHPRRQSGQMVGPVCLHANLWYSFPTRDPGAMATQQRPRSSWRCMAET